MFDNIKGYGHYKDLQIERRSIKSVPVRKKSFVMAQLNRITNDWVSSAASVNFDLHTGLSVMRARARDLIYNDPIAKKFIRLLKKNVIGPHGFGLKVKSYDWIKTQEGMKQVLDKFANRLIQDKFWYWSKKKNCSIVGDISFRELNELVLSSVATDGECFIHHLKGKEYGGKFGYTLQILDPSLIDERYNVPRLKNGNYIQMGIEYTPFRKPIRYWLRKINPSDEIYLQGLSSLHDGYYPIEAENITHLFLKEVINQGRGIPWFAPGALRMHMLNKTSEAAVINFRVGASKTLLLKQTEQLDPDIEKANGENLDPFGNTLENVEPGETYKIPYGYDPVDYNPQYPNSEFGIFTDSIMQQIASGFDVAHSTLSGNYKGTTWTSSRTALNDERDGWKTLQGWFSEHFLDDCYTNWLEMALLSNQLPLPDSKFEKFNEPFWYPRKFEFVDPDNELSATIKEFEYGFKTYGEIIGESGKDLEEHLEELAEERKLFEKYGIKFPSKGSNEAKPNEDETEKEIEEEAQGKKPTNGKAKKQFLFQ